MGLRSWLRSWRREREAWRLLRAVFRERRLLAGTSLKPRHAGRCVIRSIDVAGDDIHGDDIQRIHFGIVRHPRPYAFSRQSHKVLEFYTYDVEAAQVVRQRGENLTRAAGEDASD